LELFSLEEEAALLPGGLFVCSDCGKGDAVVEIGNDISPRKHGTLGILDSKTLNCKRAWHGWQK
jgi:hypothetical protein